MRLLVIDDDLDLLKLIRKALNKEYSVDTMDSASKVNPNDLKKYDLILLDISMPEMDGFEFLNYYRSLIDVPIVLLTAKDFERDKLEGFALGADDYITKPFSIKELRAKVEAHLRREKRVKKNRLMDYPMSCDLLSKKIYFKEDEIPFTSSEYGICELLIKNRGQTFSKEQIYRSVFGYDASGDSKTTIPERVKLIRTKCSGYGINPIKTVWGVGYKWEIEKV